MQATRISEDFVEAFMQYNYMSESPRLFLKWVALSTIAAAVERKVYQIWDKKIYTNMYVVLVGPAGTRKGSAMWPGIKLVRTCGFKTMSQTIIKEAFIQAIEEKFSLLSDSVEESHSSTTIFSEELGVFLGTKNDEFYLLLTDLYDCPDEWEYRTKHQGTNSLRGVWVNLLGAITPKSLTMILNNENMGIGLTSRMMFVYADRKHQLVALPYKTEANAEMFKILVNDLEAISLLSGEISTSKSFEDAYVPWYESGKVPFADEAFEGYNERRSLHLRKAAMLFCISEGNEMVLTDKHFHRALNLLQETEQYMPFALAGAGNNPMLKLQIHLEKVLTDGPKTFGELVVAAQRYAMPDEVKTMIKNLNRLGKVDIDGEGKQLYDYVVTWIK